MKIPAVALAKARVEVESSIMILSALTRSVIDHTPPPHQNYRFLCVAVHPFRGSIRHKTAHCPSPRQHKRRANKVTKSHSVIQEDQNWHRISRARCAISSKSQLRYRNEKHLTRDVPGMFSLQSRHWILLFKFLTKAGLSRGSVHFSHSTYWQ